MSKFVDSEITKILFITFIKLLYIGFLHCNSFFLLYNLVPLNYNGLVPSLLIFLPSSNFLYQKNLNCK